MGMAGGIARDNYYNKYTMFLVVTGNTVDMGKWTRKQNYLSEKSMMK